MNLNRSDLMQTGAYINGQWLQTEKTYSVMNPATDECIAQMSYCSKAETELAIKAATEAFKSYRNTLAVERSELLRRWADLIAANIDDIADIITSESGKIRADAVGEIQYANSFLYWFAEEGRRNYGETIPSHRSDARVMTIRQPIGPVALLTPWNFPIAMLTRKIGPALAVGCTTITRPSSQTPISANAIIQLAHEAGFPAGCINILSGDHAIGDILCQSSEIKKVSFTGSTPIGKNLIKQCADTVKKVSMELGGNAPFIVFADANLDRALESLMVAKFRNTGQSCVGANRVFIEESIYEEFTQRFAERVKVLNANMGNGLDKGVLIGPMITAKAASGLKAIVDEAVTKGAKILCGGEISDHGAAFLQATVLTNCNDDMIVASEELFGPVAPCFSFKTESEVIERANNSPFGLAAYACTNDLGRTWRVSEQLEAGIVGINEGFVSNAAAPFGGWKESGGGREGSKHGLDDYTELKYILAGGI